MVFNSVAYAVFLPTVLALYYVLNFRAQNVLLLLASYFFYGWWDWRFLGLLWASTAIGYVVGLLLDSPSAGSDPPSPAAAASCAGRRKLILLISFVVDLSLLGFFKYFNFFVASAPADPDGPVQKNGCRRCSRAAGERQLCLVEGAELERALQRRVPVHDPDLR